MDPRQLPPSYANHSMYHPTMGWIPTVMVPVPMQLVSHVHQMLASYGVMPSGHAMHISSQYPLDACSWYHMTPSGYRRVPSAHVTTIHEVVREANIEITPTAHMQKCPDVVPTHEAPNDRTSTNVERPTTSHPIQTSVTIQKSVQTDAPNAAIHTTCAVKIRTLTSTNGISPTEGIAAADVIAAADGSAAADDIAADDAAAADDIAAADGITAQECKKRKCANTKIRNDSMPRTKKPQAELLVQDFAAMEAENTAILAQDSPGTWDKGICRFRASAESAAKVLAWVVENTSRKLSVVATDALLLDGFHAWDAVHATTPNDDRQLQHTFVVGRAQRRAALKAIPGFADLVNSAQQAIKSMQLADTPRELEWLTGHILNQGDVNARFEYHQDTNEERNKETGRRDRRVKYTAIVKLNRGGCTSMEVCGKPEVFYHSPGGSGVIFRSDLHHRTEKAEQGIWKLALFFGVFM